MLNSILRLDSKSPGELRIRTALDECGYHASRVIHEFQMAIFHEILPHHAAREVLTPAPGEAGVYSGVGGHLSASQPVYKIDGGIPRHSMREGELGSKLGAVDGTVPFSIEYRSHVLARGVQMHM